jgi:hypothetical protein
VEVMAYFKALLQHLPGSTEESNETYFLFVNHLKLLTGKVIKLFNMVAFGENSFRGEEFSFVSVLQKNPRSPKEYCCFKNVYGIGRFF